jgi:hypothetical protein
VVNKQSTIAQKKYIIMWQEIDKYRTEERVLAMVNLDPTYSLRQISFEVGLCKSWIWNIFRKYKYHPYKAQCHQKIFAVGEESRSALCYEMQERSVGNLLHRRMHFYTK